MTKKSRSIGTVPAAAASCLLVALLAGCVGVQQTVPQPEQPEPGSSESPEAPAPEVDAEPAFAIEDFDFGNAEWLFVPYAESHPTLSLEIVDGAAEIDGMAYTVVAEETLFSDADGDGDLDALVPIEAYGGGNTIDRQWYIWANADEGAVQVGLPVARSLHCGTFTENIAAVDGGFEIHEFRRTIGEESLACIEPGSDERVRTVGISPEGPAGELWPVQLAPFRAFGGICPAPIEYHAYPLEVDVYAAPSEASEPLSAGEMHEWQVDPWPVYAIPFDDYALIGVSAEGGLGCAWGRKAA